MPILTYNGKYQVLAKKPDDLNELKEFYHTVCYVSDASVATLDLDESLLETLRAGMKK